MPEPDDTKPADEAGLSPEIRDHLGRKLRAEYGVEAEKPAFLGDTQIPPQLELQVRRLEQSERSARVGIDAIRREFGLPKDDGPSPEGDRPDPVAP